MHDELQSYSRIGLSNYEVLKTATKNPGEFIGNNIEVKNSSSYKICSILKMIFRRLISIAKSINRTLNLG